MLTPPGLGFASANPRALELAAERPGRRYYFDWGRTVAGQGEDPPNSAFTPAVSLWRALEVALGLILEEGLPQVFERHALLARAARAGIEALAVAGPGHTSFSSAVPSTLRSLRHSSTPCAPSSAACTTRGGRPDRSAKRGDTSGVRGSVPSGT